MAFLLSGSVGRGGKNVPADVKNVQNALNKVPVGEGRPNPLLDPDSICGPETIDAIQRFQLKHFGWGGADGRVDVMGPTYQKLNSYDVVTVPPSAVPGLSAPGSIEPAEPTSESFSIRIDSRNGIKSTAETWRVLIMDEANQRSRTFHISKSLDLYPAFDKDWSAAYYFKRQTPTALGTFVGAGIRFGSILRIDANLPMFEGRESWDNKMALHLVGDDAATIYLNTPVMLYECFRDSTEPKNIGRSGVYEHRMKGHLIDKWGLGRAPVLIAGPRPPLTARQRHDALLALSRRRG